MMMIVMIMRVVVIKMIIMRVLMLIMNMMIIMRGLIMRVVMIVKIRRVVSDDDDYNYERVDYCTGGLLKFSDGTSLPVAD